MNKRKILYMAVIGGIGVGLVVFPFIGSRYLTRSLTSILMFAGLAASWNIITGKTGYFSFGHGVFFGLGAYAAALLMLKLRFPFILGLLGGGVVAALFAFLIGLPILRLKGHYFAIVTLGIAEVMHGIVLNLESLTGGGVGLSLPLKQGTIKELSVFFYLIMLSITSLAVLTSYLIDRSRFGHGLVAIREDETAAKVLGINTTLYKILAYALSAVFCGFIGATYAYWITYIAPDDVFALQFSISIIVMCLIGGIGTLWGPIIGAFIFEIFSEVFWSRFLTFHSASLGVLMIVIIYLLPKGFMERIVSKRKLSLTGFIKNLKQYSE
jgi:branched-chain amino acid transport system permease protein